MTGESLSAAEIYHEFSGGQGLESLGKTHQAAAELTQRLLDRTNEVASLAERVRACWQGVSAEAAASSASRLLAVSAEISTNLAFTQSAAESQIAALQTIKNAVKPVGNRPEITAQDVYDALSGKPGYFGKLDQWQADVQHNVDAYTSYQSATSMNTDRIPARYTEQSYLGASVRLAGGPRPHPATNTREPGGKAAASHGPGVREPRPGTESSVPAPSVPVPGPREPISYEPAPRTQGREHSATGGGSSSTPPDATAPQPDSTRASSSESGLPPGYQFGPSGQPINPTGSPGSSDPRTGIDYHGTGFPGKVGSEPGARGNIGAGNRGGAVLPGEPLPARGTPGTTGKPGGMLGSGTPGKSKEKDKEKTAPPYLRETDPEVFGGSDGEPTPPVIGDRPAR
ncbi:hypothetical protein G3I59_22725 [Amycolatopsis rubida]|uniref:PPE domain-containing protein n=1 Tax=Amycolatopsis rubida TaxID=112413 RepID=A0ABX0BTL7_9PSEU|nr:MULTISPECIES: hypothetical protein [Amycolatopsis]MYW93357.1 hypothetical protein [Amycolatopsis rubida]NEC58344.1 hypothetical protein [Amycolatopsis rubida]OAP28655.1 hypothetical protein A4R44_00446 [Amycolatopsis sp. M39]